MFQQRTHTTTFQSAISLLELIYHAIVRNVRQSHGNAVVGLLVSIAQTAILVVVFYVMFTVLGLRGMAIRGDFLLYIMSGIFLFLTHNKSVSAVTGAEGPASPMMLHAPMNTTIAIISSALSTLYIQVLALMVILFVYHVGFARLEVYQPIYAFGMVLLAWFSGVAVGTVFLAAKPWAPGFVGIAQQVYTRANMFASGKMFVANTLPSSMIAMFDWNPLFHCIDQARGFSFINYNPHFSSVSYPLYLSFALIAIGMMGEFYTRRQVSISWSAGK
ncbi:ABC transporter, permease protein [Candidatus Rhodobacter oscarellae]|uniref:ABC transporter, permease protein n=1 Tax=Candidatus Rhodobacter oscarellae TaxID=1675527 RepID=A0A0J9EAT0_9RHOB|nr:ABC transporter permease [Candidatus Rhodobacter lobularis]KMW58774.1 ABC transporter, permease protein [Candidatus Rhodobacter lobularis]